MADVSVRGARAEDIGEIARVQVDTWRTTYTEVLPAPVISELSTDTAAAAWSDAIEAPPTPRHHVLVALEQQWVVGFAALAPVGDTEEDIAQPATTAVVGPLLVEPRWGRRGHGSRLLAAAVDHALQDGMRWLISWVPAADAASLAFFRSAGWAADGYARTLDTGAGEVRELRLHTALTEDDA